MTRSALAGLALSVSLAIAGCSGGSTNPPASPVPHSPTVVTPEAVAVRASDLGSSWQQRTIPGGSQVSGQITLDLCGGGYASEGSRVARLQTALKNGPTVISNEVVKYRPGGAQLAYDELKRRVAHCPSTPVVMPEAGAPKVRWHLTTLKARPMWAPTTVAVRATTSFRGKTQTSLEVFQFAGDWMTAVYSEDASPASAAAVNHAATVAENKLRGA